MNFFFYNMLWFLQEKEIWNDVLSAGSLAETILLIYPICLYIQFSFFLVDDLIHIDNNLFSSWTTICFPVVTLV